MNETIKYLERRISLRKYAQRQISQQHMDMIIEGAMRAPTAGNMMLYSILVVEDQDKKDILSETCDHQPFISKAPFVLIFLADMQRWYDYYNHSKVKEFCQQKGEPFVGPQESDLLLACSDALIAAQNAVITAESLDIGSCYIGDIMENYEIPYFTHSPSFSICEDHGYIPGEEFSCPTCGKDTEVWSRIVGYYRPIANWNKGKQEEFKDRLTFKVQGE